MKPAIAIVLFALTASAEDGASLLAKAHDAFTANQERQRYWIWTTTSTRTILDKSSKPLETLPSVTIESPIRADGKRCSAVLAWSDGQEPYLANASAEERCKVQEETPQIFRLESILKSGRGSLKAKSDKEITLAIHANKDLAQAPDPQSRCVAAVEGTIGLDPATYFPKRVDLKVIGQGCKMRPQEMEDHYNETTVKASGGMVKGSHIWTDFALETDRGGDHTRDFWIAAHSRQSQPMAKNVGGVLISGRVMKLDSQGQDRISVLEVNTKAMEISTESKLTFDTPK